VVGPHQLRRGLHGWPSLELRSPGCEPEPGGLETGGRASKEGRLCGAWLPSGAGSNTSALERSLSSLWVCGRPTAKVSDEKTVEEGVFYTVPVQDILS